MKNPVPCICENCIRSSDPKLFEHETLLKYQRNKEKTIKCDRWETLVPVSIEALLEQVNSMGEVKRRKLLRLPRGIDDFQAIIEEDFFYVDKSNLIREIWEYGDQIMLFPRPRRFGKSLNMSMLRHFFEKPATDKSKRYLFENLKIEKWSKFDEIQGKYPVINLTFKEVRGRTWERCYEQIVHYISLEFDRFSYLKECLSDREINDFDAIVNREASQTTIEYSIRALTTYLHRYHQEKVIVLLDEYDMPFQKLYHNSDDYQKGITFFGGLLGAVLKGNDALKKGVITGILRISKESLFSELNNLTVYSLLSPQFVDHFGFTDKEVRSTLEEFGLAEQYDVVKEWYDGYQFGEYAIYNPWSILGYLSERIIKTFWINTGGDDLVRDLIKQGTADVFERMSQLLQDQPIQVFVDENIVFMDIKNKPESVWNFLLFTGYLTVAKMPPTSSSKTYQLRIPNKEVQSFFINNLEQYYAFNPSNQITQVESMDSAQENLARVKKQLEETVVEVLKVQNEESQAKQLAKREKIFISYAHKDKDWLEKMREHFDVLENEGIPIDLWDDTRIKAGENWLEQIKSALETTKVAVLLVSTSFLASDFIKSSELPPLLQAAKNDGATILPLIIRPCRFNKNKQLAQYQAVNDPEKPMSGLTEHEQEEILIKLAEHIEELM